MAVVLEVVLVERALVRACVTFTAGSVAGWGLACNGR